MEARPPELFANSFMQEGGWQLINLSLHQSACHLINWSLLHINFLSLYSVDQGVEYESSPTESSCSWEICHPVSDTKSTTKKSWRAM